MSENSTYQGAKKLGSDVNQTVRTLGLITRIGLLSFIIFFAFANYALNDRTEVTHSAVWLKAKFFADIQNKADTDVSFKTADGVPTSAKAKTILINTTILTALADFKQNLLYALISAIIGAILITLLITQFFRRYGKNKSGTSKRIRGSVLVTEQELADEVSRQQIASDLKIGSVPLVRDAETQQIYISGAIGCGKGNAIKGFLDVICKRGQRFIVYDKSGEYVSKYYRQGIDIILNPFDERMPLWSPWAECDNAFDYETIASSFIPDSPSQKDDHWTEAPRSVLADLLAQLKSQDLDDIDQLFAYSQDKFELYEFLQGTSSAQILDPDSSEHASSILSILGPKIKSLRYLKHIQSDEQFSLREWVKNEASDRRVFITCSQRQKKAIQPLMTAWLDIVISEVLSLPEHRERRVFSIIDELASLDPINSLFDGINEGRKFGLCHILSVTSMEALKDKYGDKKAKTIIGMCSTKINYRCDEPDTAKWLADLYGEEDVQDSKQSVTLSDRSDSTNLHDQRTKRHILLPTEFMDLADQISVVKLGRSLPIAKVEVPYLSRPDIARAMILQTDEPALSVSVDGEDEYSIENMIDLDESDTNPQESDNPVADTGKKESEQLPLL